MAFKKQYKKRYGKKQYKKKIYNKYPAPTFAYRSPVPPTMVTKMRFVRNGQMGYTLGIGSSDLYKTNSIYNPYSISSHCPRGFNELTKMYAHWYVLGSKATVKVINQSFGSSNPLMSIQVRNNTTVTASSIVDTLENHTVVSKILGDEDGTNSNAALSMNFSSFKYFNQSRKTMISANEFKGTASGDPTDLAYFHLNCQPTYSTTDTVVVDYIIIIDYIVQWVERKQPPSSTSI